MTEKEFNINSIVDENILEKHITRYINGMGKILAGVFIFLCLADLVVSVFVYFGYFPFHMQSIKGGVGTYAEFLLGQILIQVLTFIPFLVYFLLYNKTNFSQKKTLLCILTITTTTILCFGHWKNHFISFLFSIPVVITSPLDKTRNRITLGISELLIILYAFYHNIFAPSEINILVAAISTTTIAMFYLVSLKIHSTMNGVFIEIKEYQNTQEFLCDKIAHDPLTGAFSKSALQADMLKLENYKSLAFLDIDKFKDINDKEGHHIGDSILKLFVFYLKSKELAVYRYGGDEFIILSKNCTAKELGDIIEVNKHRLHLAAKELYGCKVTLSVGIVHIDINKSAEENIQKGDKYMYISKKNGRNKISIEV